jgi:hypothetical protein
MSRRSRTANVLAALTTILLAAPAFGQAPPASAVVVNVVGAGDSQPALEASLRELLARLRLTMNPSDAAPDAILARVQIDLTSTSQATVLVTDGHTGEVRAHRIIPRDASAAIIREEIAHAVQSAVESTLLVDAPPPPPPAPAPVQPAPIPPPIEPQHEAPPGVPRTRRWFALDVTTLAGAGPFGSGAGPVVRMGGGAQLSSREGLRPSIAFTGYYAVPFQSNASLVGSYANLVSLRVTPAIEVLHASWFALDLGVTGGIDVLSVQPHSAILPSTNLGPTTSRVDPIVGGAVTARAALASSVVFVLAVDVDVDLASRRYVLDDGSSQVDVFDPWRVRPTVLAGLAFTAFGEGLFAPRVAMQESR